MDILTGLNKVDELLRKVITDEVQKVLRVAGPRLGVIRQQQAELAAKLRQDEQADSAQAIAPITQTATEHGQRAEVLSPGPAVRVKATTTPRVETTSSEIRAWAREHRMAVGDRGIIPKRIIEAYGLAHAS